MPLPAAVAVRVCASAVGPRVQEVTAAIPLAFVVTGVAGLPVPPPEVTANVTATPATGLPAPSRTITAGGEATAVPAGADWLVGPLAAIAAAVGCETVTLTGAERPALVAGPRGLAGGGGPPYRGAGAAAPLALSPGGVEGRGR